MDYSKWDSLEDSDDDRDIGITTRSPLRNCLNDWIRIKGRTDDIMSSGDYQTSIKGYCEILALIAASPYTKPGSSIDNETVPSDKRDREDLVELIIRSRLGVACCLLKVGHHEEALQHLDIVLKFKSIHPLQLSRALYFKATALSSLPNFTRANVEEAYKICSSLVEMVSKDRSLADYNQMSEYKNLKRNVSDQLNTFVAEEVEQRYNRAICKSLEVLDMNGQRPVQLPDKNEYPGILLTAAVIYSKIGNLDDTIELYQAAVDLMNELNGVVGEPKIEGLKSTIAKLMCTAYTGLGLAIHKSISEKYTGPAVPKDVYSSVFDKNSDVYKNKTRVCIESLDISRRMLMYELETCSQESEDCDGSIDRKELLCKHRTNLLNVTYALQDLYAHLSHFKMAISISAMTTALIIRTNENQDRNHGKVKYQNERESKVRTFRRLLNINERYVVCKLLFADAKMMSKRVMESLSSSNVIDSVRDAHTVPKVESYDECTDTKAFNVLETCRKIYNIQGFVAQELNELLDNMRGENLSNLGDKPVLVDETLVLVIVESLSSAAGLNALSIGMTPFDFENVSLLSSINALNNLASSSSAKTILNSSTSSRQDATDLLNFFEHYSEFYTENCDHGIIQENVHNKSINFLEDSYNIVYRICDAFQISGEIFQTHKKALTKRTLNNDLKIYLRGITSSYYAGVACIYKSMVGKFSSSSLETREDVFKKAARCLENARDLRDEFNNLYPDVGSSSQCIISLSGDICHHLAYVFIMLYQMNPIEHRSVLPYAKNEVSKALEYFKSIDEKENNRTNDFVLSWLQQFDELYQMSSVDRRSDSRRHRIRLACTLQAVYAKEAHDDILLNDSLQEVKSLYKGPIENPTKEMEEASKYVDLIARVRKHDDTTVESIRQMAKSLNNVDSYPGNNSLLYSFLKKIRKVTKNFMFLLRDEIFLWTTIKFMLFMIAMLVGSMTCFYFLYYHTHYFNNKIRNSEKIFDRNKADVVADIIGFEF